LVSYKTKLQTKKDLVISKLLGQNIEKYLAPKHIEPEGAFKALKDKGIKITHCEERDGAGRPIKKNRWS
jgi:hypothetical protein